MTTQTSRLKTGELHCRICALTFEQTLKRLDGVDNVNVDFDGQSIIISYDSTRVTSSDLQLSIKKTEDQIVHPNLPEQSNIAYRSVLLAFSGMSLLAGLYVYFLTNDAKLFQWEGLVLYASSALYLLALSLSGVFVLQSGVKAAISKRLSIDMLMTIAIVGAVAIGEFFEAASLAFLYSIAEWLEKKAVARARNSLTALMDLAPTTATVRRQNREWLVSIEEVLLDEIVVVKPGEKVPLDGIVVVGKSAVNQAPITGESVPLEKSVGDAVYAGSLNEEGYLEIRVSRGSKDTTLAKIIHLVEKAQDQKAPSERFVEKFGSYYTPTIVILAALLAVVPTLIFTQPFIPWFLRAITLLVISCPCALLISTPVTVISGITAAARNGVLIKGGAYFEAMGQVRAMAIDKTGTLTTGQLEVSDIVPISASSASELLQIAASLESKSTHPVAKAIVRAAQHTEVLEVQNFHSLTAQGVEGVINGQRWRVGKPTQFTDFHAAESARLQNEAKTVVAVGTESQVFGLIAVADTIRPEAAGAVQALQDMGFEIVMLTGDNDGTAKAVADSLGISRYRSGVLPEDKAQEIERLKAEFGGVVMVGDGVNDAPALATATVGVAMGVMGSDTALETADIALMADDLSKLPYLINLSRRGGRIIRQNVWFSILTKASLALGVLPGYVTLAMAVIIGDLGATLAVTGNAMRLAKVHSNATKRRS